MLYQQFAEKLLNLLQYKHELLEDAEVTDQWEPLIADIEELLKGKDEYLARFLSEHSCFEEILECDDDLAHR